MCYSLHSDNRVAKSYHTQWAMMISIVKSARYVHSLKQSEYRMCISISINVFIRIKIHRHKAIFRVVNFTRIPMASYRNPVTKVQQA